MTEKNKFQQAHSIGKLVGIAYYRVSTSEQAEDGNGLESQQRACIQASDTRNIELVKIFRAEGESAKSLERPVLQELLKYCRENKADIDCIVVHKIDRLARNTNDFATLRAFFASCGIKIISVSEPTDDTPVGKFIESTFANIAQLDNDIRAERTKAGMAEALRQGRYIFRAPFGYQKIAGRGISTIVPDEYEGEVVKEIFSTIHSGFKSIEAVRSEVNRKLKLDLRKPIIKSHFYKIITNPVYKGYIIVERMGLILKGSFEPLVSEDLFNDVQFIYKGRSKKLPKYKKIHPLFPLRGTIKHSCGHLMTANLSKGKYPHYRCTHCERVNLKKDDVESDFLKYLEVTKLKPDLADVLKIALEANWEESEKNSTKALLNINKQKTLIVRKQEMIVEKNLKGIYDDEMTKKLLSDTSAELAELNLEAVKYREPEEDKVELLSFSLGFLENMDQIWQEGDIEIKHEFQKFIFRDGVIYENRKFRTIEKPLSVELNEALNQQNYPYMTLREPFSNGLLNQLTEIYFFIKQANIQPFIINYNA